MDATRSNRGFWDEWVDADGDNDQDLVEEEVQPQLEFPIAAFPKVAQNLIEEICLLELVPPSLVGSAVLGISSASLGAGIRIQSGPIRFTKGNIYVMPIAESGLGKAAVRHVMAPLLGTEKEIFSQWKRDILPSATTKLDVFQAAYKYGKDKAAKLDASEREKATEDLIKIQVQIDELQDKTLAPCLSVADITKEKLGVVMIAQVGQALASISSEGRGVIDIVLGRYNKKDSSDEDFYTAAYTGDSIKVDRVSREPVWLTEPCLAITWMLQPDKFEAILEKPNITESGMLQRFLVCDTHADPQEVPEKDPDVNFECFSEWNSCIQTMIKDFRLRKERATILPSMEARELIRLFTNEVVRRRRKGGDIHDIRSYAARWAEQVWRVSVIWHVLIEGTDAANKVLSPETAQKVIEIVRWFAQEQILMLGVMRSKQRLYRLKKLIDILQSLPKGRCTLRDLSRRHRFEQEELQDLAKEYYHRIEILEVKPLHAGRPTSFVNLRD